MCVWLKKHWEKTRVTSAIEGTRHVSLWNNVGVRDSCMPSDGFESKSHTVLRLGAAMIVVATTADIAFAGATKKVAKGLVQSPITSSTLAWEASPGFRGWMSPWPVMLRAHHSSVGCRQRTLLRDRIDNLGKKKRRWFADLKTNSLVLIYSLIKHLLNASVFAFFLVAMIR